MYWKTTTPGELWHLVDDDEMIRAEVRQVWYITTPKHYEITGRPEEYKSEAGAKTAAEAFVADEPS